MPYGLEIINDFGSVLLNENTTTLQLKGKYTLTVPAAGGSNRSAQIEVPNSTSNAVIFVRPQASGGLDVWFNMTQNPKPGDATKTIVTIVVHNDFTATTRAFDVFHFDQPDVSVGGNFGLKLYNASGVCTFNSNIKPCYIEAEFYETPAETDIDYEAGELTEPGSYAVTQPSGQLFAIGGTCGFWRDYQGNENGYYRSYTTLSKIYGSTVTVWPQAVYIINDGSPQSPYNVLQYWSGTPGALVGNVTGF